MTVGAANPISAVLGSASPRASERGAVVPAGDAPDAAIATGIEAATRIEAATLLHGVMEQIQLAETIVERVNAVNATEAVRVYLSASARSREIAAAAAALKLDAERRAGQLFAAIERRAGSRDGEETPYAATLRELGVARRSADRWQKIASVPRDLYERYVGDARRVAERRGADDPAPDDDIRSVSASGLLRELRRRQTGEVPGADEWTSPKPLADAASRALGGVDLDPCAEPARDFPAMHHVTKAENGLAVPWNGRVWVHPPADLAGEFADRIVSQYGEERIEAALACLPAVPALWGVLGGHPFCLLEEQGLGARPPRPLAVFAVGVEAPVFAAAFREIGSAYGPISAAPAKR